MNVKEKYQSGMSMASHCINIQAWPCKISPCPGGKTQYEASSYNKDLTFSQKKNNNNNNTMITHDFGFKEGYQTRSRWFLYKR